MKRRNVEIGKMRRPMKRNKITDGFYGSTLLYVRFLVLWLLVILADFILEFRFEFLWPFYLLIRSVYDSFKYQGLAFSIFFVCIALTSDMLCFFFIPVHWLFFAASTYVWVQYVWHTDKGICAPTIILWMLFVYLEAAVRLRDVKHMPGHLDLCRPFAAHCIGYPVVTLGFGFKSYVGYRIRQRKQRDVAKENEFYMQLMQQALPHEILQQQHHNSDLIVVQNNNTTTITNKIHNSNNSNIREKNGHLPNGSIPNGHTKSHRRLLDKCKNHDDHHNNTLDKSKFNHSHSNGNVVNFEDDVYNSTATLINNNVSSTIPTTTTSSSSSSSSIVTNSTLNHLQSQSSSLVNHSLNSTTLLPSSTNNVNVTSYSSSTKKREKREQDIKEKEAAEYLQKLEIDAKKLRIDLQNSRASEQELRLQVATLTTSEKVSKGELTDMQREIEELQQRIQNLISSRASDKQTINNLERRMADERRIRCNLESQLNQERKSRKEDARVAAQAAAQSARNECTENCKLRRRELEKDLQECRQATHIALERCSVLEREKGQMVEKLRDKDLLMSALTALQEKNSHLENSLSAETRIKLDLFSALGEAKRQIEIRECSNRTQEKEIEELKSKIAQVLAVMPNDTFGGATQLSRVRLSDTTPGSTLDPNATAYTPKGSLVASTEA